MQYFVELEAEEQQRLQNAHIYFTTDHAQFLLLGVQSLHHNSKIFIFH